MEIKLLSEIISREKSDQAVFYSYFLVYRNQRGETELLPADNHAASYPLVIDEERNIVKGKVNFFNDKMRGGFSDYLLKENEEFTLYLNSPVNKKCIIINLLDNCYGHSLLKMFNIVLFYKKYAGEFDFLIITPPSLMPYLPKEILNIACVNKSFKELENGYSLDPLIWAVKNNYNSVEYAYLNTYQEYDEKSEIINFFKLTENIENTDHLNKIVFYYRRGGARRWGFFNGRLNIINFFNFLKNYFKGVEFVLLGELDSYSFPGFITDLRCKEFTPEIEFKYNTVLRESLFVTGIHGSHLIMPSLLSRQVFHLVPAAKIKNAGEDVFNRRMGIITSTYADVNMFPENGLLLSGGKKTARLVLTLFAASLEKEYKSNSKNIEKAGSQESYVSSVYPSFLYSKALAWWNRRESRILRFNKLFNHR